MATSWISLYRALLFCGAGFVLVLNHLTYQRKKKPGAKPLFFLNAGSLIYILVKLTISFIRGTPLVLLITRLNPLAAGIASISFLLLVIEYTGIQQPVSKKTIGLLAVEPIVANCLIWIDLEFFWIPLGLEPKTVSGYVWELQSIGIVNQVYMNLLMITGLLILIWFSNRSDPSFNNQIFALAIAGFIPILGNSSYYLKFNNFQSNPCFVCGIGTSYNLGNSMERIPGPISDRSKYRF